jgi:hypothetical protein
MSDEVIVIIDGRAHQGRLVGERYKDGDTVWQVEVDKEPAFLLALDPSQLGWLANPGQPPSIRAKAAAALERAHPDKSWGTDS